MDRTVLQRLREGITRQRQSLADWLKDVRPETLHTRLGPSGEGAVREHLHTLDTALQEAKENRIGICKVCNDFVEPMWLEMDYTATVCIEHLTGDQRALLENELELSQKVQKALLPQELPVINGLQIAAFSQPAHIVGGDYFDFLRMNDGSHAIAIADVMGKGMPASMLMASLQASLRIVAPESSSPADVVTRMNHLFCHNINLTKFVTFFLARYDDASHTLLYSNAGHNPPLLLRADGSIEQLRPTGAAIGLVEKALFTQSTVTLQPDDRLLLYTDGVVELPNRKAELFGEERLEQFLRNSRHLTPQQLIAALRGEQQQFRGDSSVTDDTTIIAIAVKP